MKKQTFVTNSSVPERRRFEVIQRTTRRDVEGIKLGNKEMRFHPKSRMFYTNDTRLAEEIHNTHGQGGTGDVLVVPVEKNAEPGHVRTFGPSRSFSDAWEAFEQRRRDKHA